MKILGIDGSGLVASVAVVEDDNLIGEYTTGYKKTHSQTLLPMLDALGKMIELDLNSIDAIAVAAGPGSFTGLRIASATAKGIGLSLGCPIVSVPTVDAIAFNMWGNSGIICPIMDARRGQVYTGLYSFSQDGNFNVLRQQCAVDFHDIAADINARGEAVTFLGDGVPVFKQLIEELITVPYRLAPAHLNRQHASSVATLGAIYYQNGECDTAADHRPEYLRLSQAERERLEKEGKA
ncbi:MAG: tRNA (adenosine(37)-N6)-threonylcarbamoyltransferase complex dimerization subunit type 1 TsaB [Pseudobutyrivibrio sp.]|uniref:tRNA (adenosine(37)-N6)-threonylcarbamoyltransferase complex dimerization subunit type 1 TsaB n=1 Tax=Pseudobutyrivibrio sp. TaxID=2014367 RepID=UPI0025E93566|nr:tRNA (adenosine(37)-N6)-threonylcarbamoyltransferase complex dimerization subunit type 1 TsaB [Pseudobutyrivibrio sp.]MBQ6464479.1 tRNA (adenosine(37)-N6)-threonylcarbamoyltransferase complex dimerization subunit type 1 TsaB [Pseudobutyrivibrio sp.]